VEWAIALHGMYESPQVSLGRGDQERIEGWFDVLLVEWAIDCMECSSLFLNYKCHRKAAVPTAISATKL
jgi:hypothetical protein